MGGGSTLIRRAREAGVAFLLCGDEVRVRYPRNLDRSLLEELRAHRREIVDLLRPRAASPLPAWVVTDKNFKEVVPGPPERQDFRRRVIEWAGRAWYACPVTVRETILSRHLPARDYLAVAKEIMRFIGRGE